MITKSFSVCNRFRRSAVLIFVTVCHFFVAVFFIHFARQKNSAPPHSSMNIFLIRQNANEKLKASIKKVDKKIVRNDDESKNRTLKPIVIESNNIIDAMNSEQPLAQKAKAEVNTITSKELASLDSLSRRYNLVIPKTPLEEVQTPAKQAAQDPRTNSQILTKSEKFAVALGTLDCIFQTRLADGKIIRVPGQWVEMPARSEPGRVSLRTVRFCVRAHQAEGEEGGDRAAIIAGLKGK